MDYEILKEFFGENVTLLIDGRQILDVNDEGSGSETSLEAVAQVSNEQDYHSAFLKIDYIKYTLHQRKQEKVFRKGAIQKKYIIGIFENPEQR